MTLLFAWCVDEYVAIAADGRSWVPSLDATSENIKVIPFGRFVVGMTGLNACVYDSDRFDWSAWRPPAPPPLRPGYLPRDPYRDAIGETHWTDCLRRCEQRRLLPDADFDSAWQLARDYLRWMYEVDSEIVRQRRQDFGAWRNEFYFGGFDAAGLGRLERVILEGDGRETVAMREPELCVHWQPGDPKYTAWPAGTWVAGSGAAFAQDHFRTATDYPLAVPDLLGAMQMTQSVMGDAIARSATQEPAQRLGWPLRMVVATRDGQLMARINDGAHWSIWSLPEAGAPVAPPMTVPPRRV